MQNDKAKHLVAGFLITTAAGAVVQHLAGTAAGLLAGLVACVLVAWLKEQRDKRDALHHTRDGWDAYATVCGAPFGQAALLAWPMLVA